MGGANFHACCILDQRIGGWSYVSLESGVKSAEWELNLMGFVGYVSALNMHGCLNALSQFYVQSIS